MTVVTRRSANARKDDSQTVTSFASQVDHAIVRALSDASGIYGTVDLAEWYTVPRQVAPLEVVNVGNPIIRRAMVRVRDLRKLQPGWDGYGAPAIDARIAEHVRLFLEHVSNVLLVDPAVVASGRGTVQLEWTCADCEIEVEFWADGRLEILRQDDDGPEREWSGMVGNIEMDRLPDILTAL